MGDETTRSLWVTVRGISPRFGRVLRGIRALERDVADTIVRGADVLYRHDHDTAMLRIRFDADRVDDAFVARMSDGAEALGASIIDVNRLGPAIRRRFSDAYVRPYGLRMPGLANAAEALEALGRQLGALAPEGCPPEDGAPPASLRVRFQRGDDWQLGRLRSLSAGSVSIATGCPPRKGDRVSLELAIDELAVCVDAVVLAVTPPETAELLGAFGFGARFLITDRRTQRTLERFQAIVDADPALLRRPPRRRYARYPVRWPLAIGRGAAATRTAALDLSLRGMFVASDEFVRRGTPTDVSLPLDLDGEPIHAGAMVTRNLCGIAASSRAMPPGCGLELTSMSPSNARRYTGMVERVARRARRRVVVGASQERGRALADALAAVGYPSTAVSDERALLAAAAAHPAPDLVILDASLPDAARRAAFVFYAGDPSGIWKVVDAALGTR